MINTTRKKKISFYTFGCRLNQAETAVIRNTFADTAYEIVDVETPADVVVINTCTVTENGDADTRRLVSKINRLNPAARIALIGCQAQVQKQKLTDMPNVSWVVGNAKKFDLATIIADLESPSAPVVLTPAISREPFTVPASGIDAKHRRANLKVQDGCDFFCSFCEIPYARGRARSRQYDDIMREAKILAAAGHQEIVLTGINIGTYSYNNMTIVNVIDNLEKIPNIKRIRISSIEPTTIPVELIARMASSGTKLCRHLHIPLQSGDDAVLARMQRKYTVAEFRDFIEHAHEKIPGICLGTDIIVGFPGEREKEFQNTAELFRELPLDYGHIFSYSKRSLAKSREFHEGVPFAIIQKRSEILRDVSERKRRLFYEEHLGRAHTVLFEAFAKNIATGLTDNYIRMQVAADKPLTNQFRDVRLTGINGQFARGELS